MKLFVINKDDFDNDFKSQSSQKEIHKTAYNYLLQCIGYDNSIPNIIEFKYDIFKITFTFISEKNNVYFYEYKKE